jgi:benzoyl-CoA reductase/2-hydroxyglutaryl-CoA dehydratase subunit BcrC/BadD/HgdB
MFELFGLKVFARENFTKTVPRFYIAVPHIISDQGYEWYKKEIEELKEELQNIYKIDKITDNNLINSINIYNKNRELLRQIHKLRIMEEPKLTGSEALQIYMSNNSVPKEIANNELERILNKLNESEGIKTKIKRIMLVGSIVDDTNFTRLIENAGAIIVSDSLCFGTKYSMDDVKITSGGNPLNDISKRLYYKISCPRMMDDHERRLDILKKEIKTAKVDGVILQRINNCDLHGCDNMLYEHELREQLDIPVFNIDRENYQEDTTRLQTRIEAFLEMIT